MQCAMCQQVLTVRIKTVVGYVCSACYQSNVMRARVRKLDGAGAGAGISYEEIQYVVTKAVEAVLT